MRNGLSSLPEFYSGGLFVFFERSVFVAMRFCIKRVYDPADDDDGFRVLVDRLWPRGVAKKKAEVAFWAKDLAPSTELRKWFSHDPERFTEFARRYRLELAGKHEEAQTLYESALPQRQITLLYAARDVQCNHAIVLRDWLEKFHG